MIKIKMSERGFEILCLLAFRYAINRHGTQCMTRGAGDGDTIEGIVLNNLEHINANFKCQMMEDITRELRIYDDLEADEECRWGWGKRVKTKSGHFITYENPHYLERMLNALKEDYKATHGYEWQEGVQL